MKLKRMWPSISIWVIFIIFDVLMVVSSGFFSGLFPSSTVLPYTIALTVLGVVVMGVIVFLLGKLCVYIDSKELSGMVFCKVIYVLMLAVILAGGVYYRFDILSKIVADPIGDLSLYENAMVGSGSTSGVYDLLSILYSKLLYVVLLFTGNRLYFALFFQIALFVLFVLFASLAVRVLLGKFGSICFAAYASFMPIFLENVYKCRVSTDELFYLLFALEMLIIAIYLKESSDDKYGSKGYAIWFLLVGAAVGFMTYVDAGTALIAVPFLISGFFLLKSTVSAEILKLIFVFAGAIVTFLGMVLQESGFDRFNEVLVRWSHYFFKNINTFNMFWTYTTYKIEYLVTFIVMSGVLIGFWKNRKYEKATPWLFTTMVVFFATPFFGATKMNSQTMLTVFFGFVIACVASMISMEDTAQYERENAAPAKSDEEALAESMEVMARNDHPEHLVVRPENVVSQEKDTKAPENDIEESRDSNEDSNKEESADNSTDDNEDRNVADETSDENVDEKDDEIAKDATDDHIEVEAHESTQPQQVIANKDIYDTNSAFEGYAQRYVPEGMVLPTGAEDEMDVSQSRMKMPEFNGVIAVDRTTKKPEKEAPVKEEKQAEPPKKKEYKDDFDIAYKPGDDFDI